MSGCWAWEWAGGMLGWMAESFGFAQDDIICHLDPPNLSSDPPKLSSDLRSLSSRPQWRDLNQRAPHITNGGLLAFLRNQLRLFKIAGVLTSLRSNLNLPG